MPQLFVPILVNDEIGKSRRKSLFSVTGKTLGNSSGSNSDINGYDESLSTFIPVLNKKLKNCFPNESFSFNVYEYGKNPKDGVLENFTENTTSISLGILCSAYVTKEKHKLKEKYDSITVTGNFNVIDGRISLSEVTDIEEKYKAVQDYACKNADKKHLFVYISSEEIIPDGLQENNVLVIRYDSGFPVECVFAEIFEDINEDTSTPQKYRNEFIETRAFIKLKKDFIIDRSCNCHIIKGKSNTGKSVAAEALCKYLVNSQTISGYAWLYIGDNGKLLELLRKEKEELANSRIGTVFFEKQEQRNYIKEAYPEVFDAFERLLQTDRRCAIVIDNIEHDIVDEVLKFFSRNYPMESNRYDLILTSWEGSKINRIESSIRTRTINTSDISLDFKELKAIADSVLKINDYSKKYSEAPESFKNELLNLLFQLCQSYPGYIPLVLSALNKYSMEETLEIYSEKDASDLSSIDKILTVTFATVDFLSRIVLFSYLQTKNFDEALKADAITDILEKKIFNNTRVIDYNDIRSSLNVLQQYSFLRERNANQYEIKTAVRDFVVFSKAIPNELQTARDLIITPVRKVEYAIEGKKLDEFKLYIDMISEKETLNKVLIKLCKSDSSLEFFQILIVSKRDINLNYTYEDETPLQICARKTNDTRILDFLISRGADWGARNNKGGTLLHKAAMNEDCTVLRYILEHHFYKDINETDKDTCTAGHWACLGGKDEKSIDLLLGYGAHRHVRNNDGRTLLHFAAQNKGSAVLKYILEHHIYDDINETENHGQTALHLACAKSKDEKSIELLLEYEADRKVMDNEGRTPLNCAAWNEDSTVLRYILEHHIYDDINETENHGGTALHLACLRRKDEKSIELLLKYGADRKARCRNGWTLLNCAAMNKDSTVLRYILRHHIYDDINETENHGSTALLMACLRGRDEKLIDLLLEYGADRMVRDNDGETLLHYAVINDNSTVLKYILDHHYYSDINETDNNGGTALFKARTLDSFNLLLEHGADPKLITSKGNNILHAAVLSNKKEIVEYILEHLPMIDPAQKNQEGKTPADLATSDEIKKLLEK